MIKRLCLIGVGSIGSSFVLALRKAGKVEQVIGCDRSQENLEQAMALGIIDEARTHGADAVGGCDLIMVAVPLGAMSSVFAEIAPALDADAIVTDVGSAKGSVVADAKAALSAGQMVHFVPGHPIAGTEKSGPAAAFAELFHNRRIILTPLAENSIRAIETVQALWSACGAEVEMMSVEHHDEVLAATSHLPHMLAFGLVDTLAHMEDKREIFRYAAGGFRDFTRIASSDPTMWRDICLSNGPALVAMLERYQADLDLIRKAVEQGDGERLMEIFQRAKSARDALCHL